MFVELPKVGATLNAAESFGCIESVKAVSEILSPVSGEVTEIDSALTDSPEKLNQHPHRSAWLIELHIPDSKEVATPMDATAYQAYIAERSKEHSG